VSTSPVYPQLNDRFKLGTDNGAWVQEVPKDGPARKAGLRAGRGEVRFQARPYKPGGDVITKVAGRPIDTENDVGLAVIEHEPGDTIALEIVRDGEKRTVRIKLGARPAQIDRPG
jgi:S1-C subfamily serine protease